MSIIIDKVFDLIERAKALSVRQKDLHGGNMMWDESGALSFTQWVCSKDWPWTGNKNETNINVLFVPEISLS